MTGKYHIPLLPNKTYHLFNRAVGSEKLFLSDENYFYFLSKYAEHTSAICDTWCYCLLPNHFHLLIRIKPLETIAEQYKLIKKKETPEFDVIPLYDFIMERFSNWLNGYTKAFNKMYARKGGFIYGLYKTLISRNRQLFWKFSSLYSR